MRCEWQQGYARRFRRESTCLAVVIVVTLVLAGCGGGPAPPTATTAATVPSPTTAPPTPSPRRTATTGVASPTRPASPAATATRALATPTATARSAASPSVAKGTGYGMNIWLPNTNMDRTLGLVTGAGFTWARQWIAWESVEPSRGSYNWEVLDQVVAAAGRHNVKLLLVFPKAPAWAAPNHGIPADKETYGTFLGTVAQRYKGKVAAYEIWNEQNLAGETGGRVEVREYVELLKASFTRIKAADPAATVLYGGLTPTGVNDPTIAIDDVVYLQQCYAYNGGEIKRYFDALGAHPGGMHNPPETLWPENPGPGPGFNDSRSFYFRRVEDLRKVMEEAGDGAKQIWVTEFGWTTRNEARGYEYGQYISEQNQADYLVRAYALASERWPWVGVMFLWNLNYSTITPPSDEKHPWSILNADYSPRPAYEAVKRMPKP